MGQLLDWTEGWLEMERRRRRRKGRRGGRHVHSKHLPATLVAHPLASTLILRGFSDLLRSLRMFFESFMPGSLLL